MWGWGHEKYYINLTINQPIITFGTHNLTYLVCWDAKPILHV
jgi:hypothetical protein